MTPKQAQKLYDAIKSERAYILVYHCLPGVYVKLRAFREGFQTVPFPCPACVKLVKDPDDLTYDFGIVDDAGVLHVS